MEYDIRLQYATNEKRNYRDLHFKNKLEANVFFENIINNQGFTKAPGDIWINSDHVIEICEPEPVEVD